MQISMVLVSIVPTINPTTCRCTKRLRIVVKIARYFSRCCQCKLHGIVILQDIHHHSIHGVVAISLGEAERSIAILWGYANVHEQHAWTCMRATP